MKLRCHNKSIYFLLNIFLFLILAYSCTTSQKEIDPKSLCLEFYNLNKDIDLEKLFNTRILGIREYSEYDEITRKYNRIPTVIVVTDSIPEKNIALPSFSKNAEMEEIRRFYSRCDTSALNYLRIKYYNAPHI